MNTDSRRRLAKGDATAIIAALERVGFSVHPRGDRISAYSESGRLVCEFAWQPNRRAQDGDPEVPGSWRPLIVFPPVFSFADLRTFVREVKRCTSLMGGVIEAWNDFMSSKSDRRWRTYRGFVASIFLRQDPEPDPAPLLEPTPKRKAATRKTTKKPTSTSGATLVAPAKPKKSRRKTK